MFPNREIEVTLKLSKQDRKLLEAMLKARAFSLNKLVRDLVNQELLDWNTFNAGRDLKARSA